MLINICINIFTGDILKIVFDKYLMGKLLSEYVSDGKHWTRVHWPCTWQQSENWIFKLAALISFTFFVEYIFISEIWVFPIAVPYTVVNKYYLWIYLK